MDTETTFFSYSRADSAFVLKLAKDLRAAGANLWLDQLDIKAGSHWDTSIESALNAAGRMIVVLSTTSVASNNVMDEVSFALESGKTIIPVLLNDCTTPFRLKRVQRIDFTGDYETGFKQLMQALNLPTGDNDSSGIKEAERRSSQNSEKEIIPRLPGQDNESEQYKPVTGSKKESSSSGKVEIQNNSRKYLLIAAGVILLGLVIWGIMKFSSGNVTVDNKADRSFSSSTQSGGSNVADGVDSSSAGNGSGNAIVDNKPGSSNSTSIEEGSSKATVPDEIDSDLSVPSTDYYPLRVRGCTPNTRLLYHYVDGVLVIQFKFGDQSATNSLEPGQGSWVDRAMSAGEPTQLHQKMPKETAEALISYLQNPESYWTFYCYNTSKGFMNVVKSEKFKTE